jgi:hypothetical protein
MILLREGNNKVWVSTYLVLFVYTMMLILDMENFEFEEFFRSGKIQKVVCLLRVSGSILEAENTGVNYKSKESIFSVF